MSNKIKDCLYHVNGLYICKVDINTPLIEKMSGTPNIDNICAQENLPANLQSSCSCKKASDETTNAIKIYNKRLTNYHVDYDNYSRNKAEYDKKYAEWNNNKNVFMDELKKYRRQRDDCSGDWGTPACTRMDTNLVIENDGEQCCIAYYQVGSGKNKIKKCQPNKNNGHKAVCKWSDSYLTNELSKWTNQNNEPIAPQPPPPKDNMPQLPNISCCNNSITMNNTDMVDSKVSQTCSQTLNADIMKQHSDMNTVPPTQSPLLTTNPPVISSSTEIPLLTTNPPVISSSTETPLLTTNPPEISSSTETPLLTTNPPEISSSTETPVSSLPTTTPNLFSIKYILMSICGILFLLFTILGIYNYTFFIFDFIIIIIFILLYFFFN